MRIFFIKIQIFINCIFFSHAHCEWHIAASSRTMVVYLQLENLYFNDAQPSCNNDYVDIYDGMIKICKHSFFLYDSVYTSEYSSVI
jgi:urate oxidase